MTERVALPVWPGAQAIESLRKDDDEMLRGTDWDAVEEYVCGSAGAPSESSDTGSFSHGESVGLGGGRCGGRWIN